MHEIRVEAVETRKDNKVLMLFGAFEKKGGK
jgi:hypothetical protein